MDCWKRRIEQLNRHVIHVQYIKGEKAGRTMRKGSRHHRIRERMWFHGMKRKFVLADIKYA